MGYTTGLPTTKFVDLLIRLREEGVEWRPPSPGLRDSLRAALIYMRHNVIQAAIGEQPGVSQPTVSRAIGVMTGAIVRALRDRLLTAEEVPEGCEVLRAAAIEPWFTVIGTHRGHRREAVAVVAGQRVVETAIGAWWRQIQAPSAADAAGFAIRSPA